jgi:hypothetical protein
MEERENEEASQAGDAAATWTPPALVPLDLADAQTGAFARNFPDFHGCS